MSRWVFIAIGASGLIAAAVLFSGRIEHYLLVSIMLFWPLLDPKWSPPRLPMSYVPRLYWIIVIAIIGALLVWQPNQSTFVLTTLLFAALPEEWFFRAYLLTQLQRSLYSYLRPKLYANIITSMVFSLLHGLTQNWTLALLVFLPSLVFGWLYQRSRDIVLLILVHTLANLVFVLFIKKLLAQWI